MEAEADDGLTASGAAALLDASRLMAGAPAHHRTHRRRYRPGLLAAECATASWVSAARAVMTGAAVVVIVAAMWTTVR
nr:hypothetical protein OG999_34850 [Streptomyces sp. NBC_00886]